MAETLPAGIKRIVIDNGGHTSKVGFAGEKTPRKLMHNGMVKSKMEHKVFVADQLDKCQDHSGNQYRNSLERGCLTNWDTQAEVWTRAFGPEVLKVNPADCTLMLTEIPMCPPAIQDTLDEMIFEHFGFHSYCTRPAPALAAVAMQEQMSSSSSSGGGGSSASGAAAESAAAAAADEPRSPGADGAPPPPPPPRPATLVVDVGYSATHVVPVFGSTPVNYGIKRVDVGGKLLTNHLKQICSYRSYNVMEEHHLINDVKERLCYVSMDFMSELALTRFKGKKNTIKREFILPDGVNHTRGRIRDPNEPAAGSGPKSPTAASAGGGGGGGDMPPPAKKPKGAGGGGGGAGPDEQVLKVANERFTVPELLFTPPDIGLRQGGVAEAIVQSVASCHRDLRDALYSNIVVTGGSSRFPSFMERLSRDLRALAPCDSEIEMTMADDPIVANWRGASIFAASEAYPMHVVTKKEYKEGGHSLCRRRFLAQQCG